MASRLERIANAADTTIHHVRRRDDIGARLGMRQGLAHEHLDRRIIEDVTRVVDDAVLAMGRVRVEGDVGDDDQVRVSGFDRADRALHEAVGIGAFGAV